MSLEIEHLVGLSEKEVRASQKKHGANILFKQQRKGLFFYGKRLVQEPMLLLLLIIAVLYFGIGNQWDGWLMLGGVLLIIGIDLYQERRTDKALEALKELSAPKINVIRNGKKENIESKELTVGDFLLVQEGERISGDGKIVASSNFSVDESLLTGETGAIFKHALKNGKAKPRYSDRGAVLAKAGNKNIVYTGTLAVSGQAVIKIASIGNETQYGKIGSSLSKIKQTQTPLQKQTKRIVLIFGTIGFIACISLIGIVYIQSQDLIDSLLKGLTLAISVIPEEIPVIVTVFGALGAYRLIRKKTLVRRISAVETIGHLTTLCTDKTGTLTENRMALEAIYADGAERKWIGKKADMDPTIIESALLASQRTPFDPIDVAIHKAAKNNGMIPKALYDHRTLKKEYGFDQKLKFLGNIWRQKETQKLFIKGSAENILERCKLSRSEHEHLLKKIDQLAERGLRVLATAEQPISGHLPKTLKNQKEFRFVALLGFRDPPRSDAKQAIQACRRAGIQVRMITGDHPETARHIAQAVGIQTTGGILTGTDLDNLNEQDLARRIKTVRIFARVIPEQKLKIISALKQSGEVVGMIGDGVNDAPSLKNADIGIAMGQRGTNVAREASDIILLDDRLQTVIKAVIDGRRIFDNIQKSFGFIFTVHVYVILLALLIPVFGLPAMLLPIHIVLLELIIDPTCAIVFESIPAEEGIIKRKPRDPKKFIISPRRFSRVIFVGIIIFLITAGAYLLALANGLSDSVARTIGFSILLWSNLFLVLTSVSRTQPVIQSLRFLSNRSFLSVYAVMITGLLLLIYIPQLNTRLGFTTIPPWIFLITILLGFLPMILGETMKRLAHPPTTRLKA